jgi:hypothetical protein
LVRPSLDGQSAAAVSQTQIRRPAVSLFFALGAQTHTPSLVLRHLDLRLLGHQNVVLLFWSAMQPVAADPWVKLHWSLLAEFASNLFDILRLIT